MWMLPKLFPYWITLNVLSKSVCHFIFVYIMGTDNSIHVTNMDDQMKPTSVSTLLNICYVSSWDPPVLSTYTETNDDYFWCPSSHSGLLDDSFISCTSSACRSVFFSTYLSLNIFFLKINTPVICFSSLNQHLHQQKLFPWSPE